MRQLYGYEGNKWVAYFWFISFAHISLGVHVYLGAPNIEIHLPFGFMRLGVRREWRLGLRTLTELGFAKSTIEEQPA